VPRSAQEQPELAQKLPGTSISVQEQPEVFQKLPNLHFGWVFKKGLQGAFSMINGARFGLDQGQGLPEAPN